MTPFGALVIDVLGGNIRVSLTGSNYAVTYQATQFPAVAGQNASGQRGPERFNDTRRVPSSRLESGQRQSERDGLDRIEEALSEDIRS